VLTYASSVCDSVVLLASLNTVNNQRHPACVPHFDFVELSDDSVRTSGNKYKLIQHCCHYDLRNCNFTNRVIPIWNSLRNQVGSAETVNIIQFRFDSVWLDQDVLYDYNADLHRKPFLYSSIMYITSSFQTFQ